MEQAEFYIKSLNLGKHPEGGYFREVYRSLEEIPAKALPARFEGARSFSTSIYFLLPGDEISVFHKIRSDEIWHFYKGAFIRIHIIDSKGNYSTLVLGDDPFNSSSFQQVVPQGSWFAAESLDPLSFSLAGCTVAPGFDFKDFEMAERETLMELFPQHGAIIEHFTHG